MDELIAGRIYLANDDHESGGPNVSKRIHTAVAGSLFIPRGGNCWFYNSFQIYSSEGNNSTYGYEGKDTRFHPWKCSLWLGGEVRNGEL